MGALSRPPTLIEIERAMVRTGGFRQFARLAFPIVDPSSKLLWNWHHDAIAEHLQAVAEGQITKLVINVPPGSLKTSFVSIMFPSWVWTTSPGSRFIAATYAQDLSDKDAGQQRDLVMSEWYQSRWGSTCTITNEETKKIRYFVNTAKGWRFSTSVGGTMTGYHSDYHIGDDLIKAQDAKGRSVIDPIAIQRANKLWFSTMASRARDPKTLKRILIMQRLHRADPAGKAIELGWESLVIPNEYQSGDRRKSRIGWEDPRSKKGELLHPERFGENETRETKINLGSDYNAQYNQDPVPEEGALFKKDYLHHWGEATSSRARVDFAKSRLIQSWDCAFKNLDTSDFVVGQLWARVDAEYYLVDQVRGRWSFLETLDQIKSFVAKWPKTYEVHIEGKANGSAILDTLKGQVSRLVEYEPRGSKEQRAQAILPLWRAGNVYLPPRETPWVCDDENGNGGFVGELLAFPFGTNDDQVDAMTQALDVLDSAESDYILSLKNAKAPR